ncbi:ABC transporter permease [Herbidospora sp. RD11066]
MTGTAVLLRFALRRDRLMLPLWTLVIVALPVGTASALAELYADAAQRISLGMTIMANPALQALTGPVYDGTSIGGLTAWRATNIAAVLAALMSTFIVIRHTRAEEESGRAELIGAAPVGRYALPAAAVLTSVIANLTIAVLTTVGLAGQGLPAEGSAAFAASVAGVGLLFTGIAAVAAQLTVGARAATSIAVAALGLFFAIRAAGDAAGGDALSWASPLGWAQRTRAFAGERWWVPALFVAVAVALLVAADALARRRDLGGGLLAARRGPAAAAPSLRSAFALARRLHRDSVASWAVSFAVVGAVFGGLAETVGELAGGSPQIAELLAQMGGAGALVDTFFATELDLFALVAGGYAVQAALRPRVEEVTGRAEPVLASAVPRGRWLLGHVACSLAGSALILTVAGVAAGLAHGVRVGEPVHQVVRIAGAAVAQVPAVWVMAGIAVLLFGLLPRATAAAWAFLVAFAVLDLFGQLLQIDERVRFLSPYAHLPALPGGEATVWPYLWLGLIAAALIGAGVAGFTRRDLEAG